jgi:hypothetical protein
MAMVWWLFLSRPQQQNKHSRWSVNVSAASRHISRMFIKSRMSLLLRRRRRSSCCAAAVIVVAVTTYCCCCCCYHILLLLLLLLLLSHTVVVVVVLLSTFHTHLHLLSFCLIAVCFILMRNKESKERVREQPLLLVLLSRTVVVVTYCCCCLLLFFFSISFNTHISFLFDCCFNLQMSSPSKSPTKKKQRPAARPPPPPAARLPLPPAARPPPPVARPLLPPAGRPLLPPAGRPPLPLNQPVYCQPVPFVPNFARSNPSLPYFPPPMSPWVMNQYSLHAEHKSELVSADTSKDKQADIAFTWFQGDFDVFLSTICGLVGNESSRCRNVLVAGYLFNLISIVQAIGRLRPSQRASNGSFEVLLHKMPERHLMQLRKVDDNLRKINLEKGLLTPEKVQRFNKVATFEGLHQWATADTGCRLVAMQKWFGFSEGVRPCKVCDRCQSTPVQRAAAASMAKANANNTAKNAALNVLRRLQLLCLVCGSKSCNGEKCIKANYCFKCGCRHFSKTCTFTEKISIMFKSRVCPYCLDLNADTDHSSTACPTDRRLKRLLIRAWEQDPGFTDLATFLTKILCSKEKYYEFLAPFDKTCATMALGT